MYWTPDNSQEIFSCNRASEFVARNFVYVERDVHQHGGLVFDSWDPNANRIQMTAEQLRSYPVFDESGLENRVYSREGRRIPRVKYIADEFAGRRAGVLLDLHGFSELFAPLDEDAEEEPQDRVQLTVYRQSFFNTLGHAKANKVVSSFGPLIEEVNTSIRDMHPEDPLGLDNLDLIPDAVTPLSSQFYNQYSHNVAAEAGDQSLQKGLVTAALASSYEGENCNSGRKGQNLVRQCNACLPHKQYFRQLRRSIATQSSTDLRCENNFSIDLMAFPEAQRNGR
jgi:hypothetical protein